MDSCRHRRRVGGEERDESKGQLWIPFRRSVRLARGWSGSGLGVSNEELTWSIEGIYELAEIHRDNGLIVEKGRRVRGTRAKSGRFEERTLLSRRGKHGLNTGWDRRTDQVREEGKEVSERKKEGGELDRKQRGGERKEMVELTFKSEGATRGNQQESGNVAF